MSGSLHKVYINDENGNMVEITESDRLPKEKLWKKVSNKEIQEKILEKIKESQNTEK